MAPEQKVPARPKRDTGWRKAGRDVGVYRRGNEWGFYDKQSRNVKGGCKTREDAKAAQAKMELRKQSGLPAPDTRKKIGDYLDLVDEKKRRSLSKAGLKLHEHAVRILRKEVGHLKPGQCGPNRLERLEADLADGKITGNKLERKSVERYMTPLKSVMKHALRDGAIPVNPFTLMEREKPGRKKPQHKWSREDIANLIDAAERLAREPFARNNYSPIIKCQIGTGMRPSETLALRVRDVDLLAGFIHVEHSLERDCTLSAPKTDAGFRLVPISDELVKLFVEIIPEEGDTDDFVFHALGNPKRPISYTNYRDRGFIPAVKAAGLTGKGLTPHKLRRAAVSAWAWAGITLVEISAMVGHADPSITAKAYADIFEPTDVYARVREAQSKVFGRAE
jgi:integrase